MPDFEDVRRIALALPDAHERPLRGRASWRVGDRLFVWERPLGKRDRAELGDAAPDGAILGVRVESLAAKEALVADPSGVYFTTSHFDGNPTVLVQLARVDPEELRELTVEAWLLRAPASLRRRHEAELLDERS